MTKTYFHVAPRYTSGSPAMVSEEIAREVMDQEKRAFGRACALGEATRLGETLGRIVYSTVEMNKHIYVHDLLTGARYKVPVKEWEGKYWYNRSDTINFLIQN